MSEASSPESERLNCQTIVWSREQASSRNPICAHDAFIAAYPDMCAAAESATAPAVWIAAVDPEGRVVQNRVLEDNSVLTIGRHAVCSFRLSDLDVSLRHVVTHIRHTADGRTAVRLWDLHTRLSFTTEDGTSTSALVAEGPLFVSIGRYVLLFLPLCRPEDGTWPDAEEAWHSLPDRRFVDRRAATSPPSAARALRPVKLHRPRAGNDVTRITLIDAPSMLGEAPPVGVACAKLSIEVPGGRIEKLVSAEHIDRGILLGRYNRCQLCLDDDDRLSRVHLLLVRIDSEIWAIDTASTNGTRLQGRAIAATVLGERDTLLLAAATLVRWHLLSYADA